MLLLASNASRSGQGKLEGVPSISSMDAERFGMASRPLQRYAFAGERVQLALQRLCNAICQLRTRAVQQKSVFFDHLVSCYHARGPAAELRNQVLGPHTPEQSYEGVDWLYGGM